MASVVTHLPRLTVRDAAPLAAWSLLLAGSGLAIQGLASGPAFALVLAALVAVGCGMLLIRDSGEMLQRLVLAGSAAGLAAFAASWVPGLAAVCWGSGVGLALTRRVDVSRLGLRALAGGWGALAGSLGFAALGVGGNDPSVGGLLLGLIGAEVVLSLGTKRATPVRRARALRASSELTRPLLDAGLDDFQRASSAGSTDEAERLLNELVRACSEAEQKGAAAAEADPGEALRGFAELSAARRQAQEEFLAQQAEALAEAERAAVALALLSAPGAGARVELRVEACA